MSDPKAARGVFVSARGLEAALVLPNAEGASLCVYDGDRETTRLRADVLVSKNGREPTMVTLVSRPRRGG